MLLFLLPWLSLGRVRQSVIEDLHRSVRLLTREHEWRREADAVLAGAEQQQAALERGVDDGVALCVAPEFI